MFSDFIRQHLAARVNALPEPSVYKSLMANLSIPGSSIRSLESFRTLDASTDSECSLLAACFALAVKKPWQMQTVRVWTVFYAAL